MDKDGTRRKLPDEALLAMIDSLEDQITLVDTAGNIVFVNDSWLRFEGDRCLRAVGGSLRPCARRAADVAARLGGEEFWLLLCDTSAEQAARVAEPVRRTVAQLGAGDGVCRKVTVSIGVATAAPDWNGSPETLMREADAALYAAKRAGRDCVRRAAGERGKASPR